MAKLCNQPLRLNPFISDRDPATGQWIIIKIIEYSHPATNQQAVNQ